MNNSFDLRDILRKVETYSPKEEYTRSQMYLEMVENYVPKTQLSPELINRLMDFTPAHQINLNFNLFNNPAPAAPSKFYGILQNHFDDHLRAIPDFFVEL